MALTPSPGGRGARRPRVAALFERFGPYHVARLDAAAARLDVVGVEMARTDATYAWDSTEGQGAFERVTICSAPGEDPTAPRNRPAVFRTLDAVGPDAVAIPGWSHPMAVAALAWCLKRGVPSILMSDSTQADAPRRRPIEAVKRRIVALFDAALVAGEPQRDYVVALGMPPARVRDGYDVVDNAYFATGAAVARAEGPAARRRHGLPAGPYFLASSRFVTKKNIPTLLAAYDLHRAEAGVEPWPLVLAGDGPLRGEIERIIVARGLGRHVILPGFLQYDALPAFYGLAGAFVLASTTEQWGLVVNEAMASGLPVLVSERCGCAPDLVADGEAGLTFDPRDAAALARLMRLISTEAQMRDAMARAASRRVARWGLDRFADGLAAAAETALAASRRRGLVDRAFLGAVARALR